MARIVKEQEYAARRNAILDVAQRLVYTKGYEQMAIQDILDELEISKGAFFHYFNSKQMLLEAIIERMRDEVAQIITPIVHDPHLPALENSAATLQRSLVGKQHRRIFCSHYCASGTLMTTPSFARNSIQPDSKALLLSSQRSSSKVSGKAS